METSTKEPKQEASDNPAPAATAAPEAQPKNPKPKGRACIIIAVVVILIAIGLGVVGVVAFNKIFKGDNDTNGKTTTTKLSEDELNKYDGTTLDISSDNNKVSGKVALSKDDKGRLQAYFRIKINDEIPSNHKDSKCNPLDTGCEQVNTAYYYVGILQNSQKERELSSQLISRFCTKEDKNFDPFDHAANICLEQKDNTIEGLTTTTFVMDLGKTFSSLEEILDISYLEVHDASEYFLDECERVNENMTNCNRSVDTNAGEAGPVLKTYSFSVSE